MKHEMFNATVISSTDFLDTYITIWMTSAKPGPATLITTQVCAGKFNTTHITAKYYFNYRQVLIFIFHETICVEESQIESHVDKIIFRLR